MQVAGGSVTINDKALNAGDGALLSGEPQVRIGRGRQAELLVFDLPGDL